MLRNSILLSVLMVIFSLVNQSAAHEFEFPIFYKGQVDTFTPGVKLFIDRNHKLSNKIPNELKGMSFIRSHWSGVALRSLDSDYIYVLAQAEDTVLQSELLNMGFRKSNVSDFQLYGTSPSGQVVVYDKSAEKGDEIIISRSYGIILSRNSIVLKAPRIDTKKEVLYNGIELPSDPRARTDMLANGYNPSPVPYLKNPPQIIPINIGRQLFIDDFLIENTTLSRTYHKPKKYEGNPVLIPETELEKYYGAAVAAPKSGGLWWDPEDQVFKVWYEAGWLGHMAYATSQDGIQWDRPSPGRTRIVLRSFRLDSTTVFLDYDAKSPDERFKMFLRGPDVGQDGPIHAAYVSTSPDGIIWKTPLPTGGCGDRSSMFYNPYRKKWIYSIRGGGRYPSPYGRARYYREHDDYMAGAKWFDTDLVFWSCADNLDPPDPKIGEKAQLYNLDAVAYESLMLGFHQIHLGPPNKECAKQGIPKTTELKLSYSRDGFHWYRPDREVFIAASRKEGFWDRGYVQSVGGLCTIIGDELWFYYIGFRGNTKKVLEDPSADWTFNGMHANASMGIAKLRRDGFASMDAGEYLCVLTTRPVTFEKGQYLFVNVNNPTGQLYIEVLNEKGNVIKGFSSKDCKPIAVNSTIEQVQWNTGKNLADLQGKPVKFRFHLIRGQLYSFWVSPDESGASYGYTAGGGPGYTSNVDTVGRVACDK